MKDKVKVMTDKAQEAISKYWPIILNIVLLAFSTGVMYSKISENSEKNYRLYLQFDEYKKASKTDDSKTAEELKDLTIAVTRLTGKIDNLDDRYALRKELDARHFKSAYRGN